MFMMFCFFLFLFYFFYFFYSFLLLLLMLEFLLLFIFFSSTTQMVGFSISLFICMLLACYFVMEAILGMCMVLSNYRYFGKAYFFLW